MHDVIWFRNFASGSCASFVAIGEQLQGLDIPVCPVPDCVAKAACKVAPDRGRKEFSGTVDDLALAHVCLSACRDPGSSANT
jgi:hypothetical protein